MFFSFTVYPGLQQEEVTQCRAISSSHSTKLPRHCFELFIIRRRAQSCYQNQELKKILIPTSGNRTHNRCGAAPRRPHIHIVDISSLFTLLLLFLDMTGSKTSVSNGTHYPLCLTCGWTAAVWSSRAQRSTAGTWALRLDVGICVILTGLILSR